MTAHYRVLMLVLMVMISGSPPLRAQQPGAPKAPTPSFQDALKAKYDSIQARKDLTDAQKQAERAKAIVAISRAADTFSEQLDELRGESERVRLTGDLAGADIEKIKDITRRLKEFEKSPLLPVSGAPGELVSKGTSIGDTLEKIDKLQKREDLPPTTRDALSALQVMGTAMKDYGDKIPVVGPGVQTFGEVISGLTEAVENVKTREQKEGFMAGNAPELEGLEQGEKKAAPSGLMLREKELLIVELRGVGENAHTGTYMMRLPKGMLQEAGSGPWRKVEYKQVAAIIADYKLANYDNSDVKMRAPSVNDVLSYLNPKNKNLRDDLKKNADARARAEPLLREIVKAGKHLNKTVTELGETRNTVNSLIKSLNIPVDPVLRDRLVERYLDDSDRLRRAMWQQTLALHPGLDAMLRAQNKTIDTNNQTEMGAAVQQWIETALKGATAVAPVPAALEGQLLCDCVTKTIKVIRERWAREMCEFRGSKKCAVKTVSVNAYKYQVGPPAICKGGWSGGWGETVYDMDSSLLLGEARDYCLEGRELLGIGGQRVQ